MSAGLRIGLLSFIAGLVLAAVPPVGASVDHDELAASPGAFAHAEFIARFSGEMPLGPGGDTLPARSTREQRELAAAFLIEQFAAIGLEAERWNYAAPNAHFVLDFLMPPMRGANVVARLPATVPDASVVIVGAHYDSDPGSPGANDNATGTAAVLAAAEQVSKLVERRVAFEFVLFDQEEENEVGSQAYAAALAASGRALHSMHNVDLAGWDGDGDRVVEVDMPTRALEALYRRAANNRGVTLAATRYNSSDHISFRALGYPAACISEEYAGGDSTPHIHKPTDRLEYVDLEYAEQVSGLLTEALTLLASEG